MDATTAILGFGATIIATVLTGMGVVFGMMRYINSTRLELKNDIKTGDDALRADIKEGDNLLRGEVKDVRQASESAHKEILGQLGDIKVQQATHTERLNCIEKHLNMSREDDD